MLRARPSLFFGVLITVVVSLLGAHPLQADEIRYYGVFFGPTVSRLNSEQQDGTPLSIRNFLSFNHSIDSNTRLGASLSWNWRPVQGQDWSLRDPFIKLSKPSAWESGSWNWYTDLRLHLPVTESSRSRDLWAALQSFNSLDYDVEAGGFGLYSAIRRNFLGSQGSGDEWEFYAAPHAHWQALKTLSVGMLVEWDGGTPFESATDGRVIYSDGWNLQPGLSWDPTPALNLSPFLNLPLSSGNPSSQQPTLGMTLSWKIGA
jgi:hypothetical protein